jgi:hypothetical protein
MKKAVFSAVLAMVMVFGASAQVWIGGAVGFNSSKFEHNDDFEKRNKFSISPEVGFSVADRFDIGLTFAIGTEKHEYTTTYCWGWQCGRQERDEKATSWAIAPFMQYKAIEFGRFSLLGRATLAYHSQKGILSYMDEWGYRIHGNNDYKITGFSANITPFLHYAISDRFNVFTAMNFLSLNYGTFKAKDGVIELGSTNGFNIGVDANNLTNLGAIQLGFICKF